MHQLCDKVREEPAKHENPHHIFLKLSSFACLHNLSVIRSQFKTKSELYHCFIPCGNCILSILQVFNEDLIIFAL